MERLLKCPQADPVKVQQLKRLRDKTDPFELAKRIEQKLERIFRWLTNASARNPNDPIAHPRLAVKNRLSARSLRSLDTQLQK